MKDFEGVLALQVDSITGSLFRLQEERSNRLLRQAESQAQALWRATHLKLLKQAREAVRSERRRREKALRMAEHRIRAKAGDRMQAQYAALLRAGWPVLVEALERRWSDQEARASWSDMVADRALAAFGSTAWTIEHPLDWTEADSERLARTLEALGVPAARFDADASASAGLRVRSGTACLDGTIDGLLAERSRVEGRLLATWERLEAERGQDD